MKEILNKKHIVSSDYHKFIKGKNVIIIACGSNSLYVPNCGDLVNSFDVAVGMGGTGGIVPIQKQYPHLLGDRLDVLYYVITNPLNSFDKVSTSLTKRIEGTKPWRGYKKAYKSKIDLKYFVTQKVTDSNNKFNFKGVEVEPWYGLFQKAMHKQVPKESRKQINTGATVIYHLLMHEPKSLYILGYNFAMQGSLKGSYDHKLKIRSYAKQAVNITSQCKYPNHRDVDYRGAFAKQNHSQYLTWKAIKIIYDLFDSVSGDPMFEDIISMSDKEYKEANSLNIDD